ncbi:MAG: alpha/beta hydrolase family protein, partial [Gemmatimonadota bacterium]
LGNVTEFAWSDSASMIALAITTTSGDGNGVQVYDAASGRLRSLDTSRSTYTALAWREKAPDVAVLRSRKTAREEDAKEKPAESPEGEPEGGTGERGPEEGDVEESDAQDVLAWRGAGTEAPRMFVLRAGAAGVSDTLEVVTAAAPAWSDDGTMISIGLRPVEPTVEDAGSEAGDSPRDRDEDDPEDEDDEDDDEDDLESADDGDDEEPELPGVQIWHSSDVRLFPQQQAAESSDERRTLLAVWHLDEERVVQIGTDLQGGARLLEGWARALEELDAPYPWGAMFGRRYHDVWVVDVETGAREKLLERVRYAWPSDGGRWLVSFDGENYTSHDLETGRRYDLTSGLDATFADTTYDTPTDLLPPFGFAPGGWLEGDAAVLLYDQYDVWKVAPDGSGATRLTDGSAERVEHRVAFEPDDDTPGLDPNEPIYLSLHGEWSEKRGYARAMPDGSLETLLLSDKFVTALTKADSSDVYLYREMAFDDPPDYVVAEPDLADPRQVTEMNPFFAEYAWGRAELVDFTSESGRPLQAVLYYPANYEEGTRVPTIVYTYELRSPSIHVFEVPSERDYYNFAAWTHQGYAVLQPDIVYRARDPGISALEAVRAAVAKVVEMGVTDPEAVGLIGHSWGGYQATFLPTRTDIFAASVAGAPLTDFVSFMGAIHWNPGIPEVDHWETGQARMEVPFWDDPEAHRRNSPIHEIDQLETPILMAFGNEDGVVDWDQGTEFYNFARRAGKQMVLLVYEGEDHGFRQKPNQIDYHRRILEWFGHYLKGEPAPAWITEGVRLEELEDEKKRVAKPTRDG